MPLHHTFHNLHRASTTQHLLKQDPHLHTDVYHALKEGNYQLVKVLASKLAKQDAHTADTSLIEKHLFQFILLYSDINTIIPKFFTKEALDFKLLKDLRDQMLLSEAIKHKKSKLLVQPLLENGIVPDQTALYLAVQLQQTEIVERLLQYGADADIVNPEGQTPLHYAACHCDLAIVETLLKKGVHVNSLNKMGHTPLYEAVYNNRLSIVELLIRYQADIPNNIIYMAIKEKKQEAIIQGLLSHRTAEILHDVIEQNRLDVMPRVMQYFQTYQFDVDIKDKIHHKTALYKAISQNNMTQVNLLLAYGASIDTRDGKKKSQETLLHHAARVASPEIIETLLQHTEHGTDTSITNASGNTPLDEAMLLNRLNIVKVLIKFHNTIPLKFLQTVVKTGQIAILEMLIEHKFSFAAKDHNQSTLLHLATQVGNIRIMALLLDQKLAINARDQYGNTALTVALKNDNQEAIGLLRAKGANKDPHLSHKIRASYLTVPANHALKSKASLSDLPTLFNHPRFRLNQFHIKRSISTESLSFRSR